MRYSVNILTNEEVSQLLTEQPGWSLIEGKLVRNWLFANFVEAMDFVQQIAALAEESNHHPDIDIRYNRVRLALSSHDAGGLTSRDHAMVKKLDRKYQNP